MDKTTKARAYLEERGWIYGHAKDDWWWPGWPDEGKPASYPHALAIQRARDAIEERAAWVAFAAAFCKCGTPSDDHGTPTGEPAHALPDLAADYADDLLDAYRAKFAGEVE